MSWPITGTVSVGQGRVGVPHGEGSPPLEGADVLAHSWHCISLGRAGSEPPMGGHLCPHLKGHIPPLGGARSAKTGTIPHIERSK